MQNDGNLVLYAPPGVALWSSGTGGQPNVKGVFMQTDGNLVVQDTNSQPLWASGTFGNPGAILVVQSDGNLVIQQGDNVIWASNTEVPATPARPANSNLLNPGEGLRVGDSITSEDNSCRLILQADGNLVEYRGATAVWASNTTGLPSYCLTMQPDGNLVLYDVKRNPIWASNTSGNDGVGMILQNDGNMVIYAIGTTQAIFATGPK
jgi:hypothetical protein